MEPFLPAMGDFYLAVGNVLLDIGANLPAIGRVFPGLGIFLLARGNVFPGMGNVLLALEDHFPARFQSFPFSCFHVLARYLWAFQQFGPRSAVPVGPS
jgi:hypothetical protein